MAYKLAVFDFDGTLADSADWTMGIMNELARRHGFRTVSDEEIAMLRGRDNRAIVRYLGVPAWKMPLIANDMRKRIAQDADRIRLFAGVEECLRTLHGRGVSLAVVTSNAEANVRRILGERNAALIRHYACGASIFGKARKFRAVLKASGLAAGQAIGIGDETRDIEAAARAGIAAGAVTWGYATADLLRSYKPTHLFDSFEDLVAAFPAS